MEADLRRVVEDRRRERAVFSISLWLLGVGYSAFGLLYLAALIAPSVERTLIPEGIGAAVRAAAYVANGSILLGFLGVLYYAQVRLVSRACPRCRHRSLSFSNGVRCSACGLQWHPPDREP